MTEMSFVRTPGSCRGAFKPVSAGIASPQG